ncbi:hypothetical protein MKEN_01499500 [Mycena kentingensis (nom. inval.)]|nr:hypothetical protein MKEN_01499500 [Mycena kentingensis (nom. inval.)]
MAHKLSAETTSTSTTTMDSNSMTPTSPEPFLTAGSLLPLTLGTWISLVLLTSELFLAGRYFSSKTAKADFLLLKLGIATNLVLDIFGVAACCVATYYYTVTDWGKTEEIALLKWPIIAVVFTTGGVTAISQLFMVLRYWLMTRHHVVFAFLILVLATSLAGTFGTGAVMIISPDGQNVLATVFLYLGIVASSVDTGLTAILLFARKKLEKTDVLAYPRSSLPKRFFSGLIETGTLTAAVTIAGSITSFGAARESRAWIACAFVVARVYSCTVLFILCSRPEPVEHLASIYPPVNAPQSRAVPIMVMDDADAFRITKKRIELHNRNRNRGRGADGDDSDSSSDVSRNLNAEIDSMEKGHGHGRSRRASESSASVYDDEDEEEDDEKSVYDAEREEDEDVEVVIPRADTPSEYESDVGARNSTPALGLGRQSSAAASTTFVTPSQTPRL